MTATDPRLEAFLSSNAPDVFRSVLGSDDVWRPDRLDVEEIHREARAAYALLLDRNAGAPDENRASPEDRMLLIKGDSGSGKTHLMRAFRTATHQRGVFAYLHLTTGITDYDRYLLLNVLSALQKPHNIEFSDESSLSLLSRGILQEARLFESPGIDAQGQLQSAQEAVLWLERHRRFEGIPSDVLQAILSLQLSDPAITKRVYRFLRCDELNATDSALLGGITTRKGDEAARETLHALAALVRELQQMPLVVCVDQLEDVYMPGPEQAGRFRAAISALQRLTETGNVAVIVATLTDIYSAMCAMLDQSLIDRLEGGIRPLTLASAASADEACALLGHRLRYLLETLNAPFDPAEPLFPFKPDVSKRLAHQRFRTIVRIAGAARERSMLSGQPPIVDDIPGSSNGSAPGDGIVLDQPLIEVDTPIPAHVTDLATQWNDFTLTFDAELPESGTGIVALLSRVIAALEPEISPSRLVALQPLHDGWRFDLTIGDTMESSYLAVANESPAFGHLGKAIQGIGFRAASHELSALVVRNGDFPKNPKTQIAKIIGALIAQGGRTVMVGDQEMRVMLAYFEFTKRSSDNAYFEEWRRDARPLVALPGIQALLRIDGVPAPTPHLTDRTKPEADRTKPTPAPAAQDVANEAEPHPELHIAAPSLTDAIELGTRSDGSALTLMAHDLTRHAAILGGAGSGKTTLGFRLIEQLLARGVHAVLIDRKGDLATFSDPRSWDRDTDRVTRLRRDWLRTRVDIQFFTPGAKEGRDLSISTLPAGLDGLGASDAEQEARDAADGLGAMLEWGPPRRDRLAVLKQAITTLGTLRPRERSSLSSLIDFISSYPPELLAAIGKLDRKLLDKVVQDIETLRINEGRLLDSDAEALDVAQILGPGDVLGGKTRLTIISTKFLGSVPTQLFWIARFLSEVSRYASRNPKPTLQGVVFLDEADMYLPATSKPATKQPLENLIRRARSAGIGIFLATQSPGDLDYKSRENITTWLVGRVSQERAIEKLRPVFGNSGRTADELPALTVGNFFAVDEHGVRRFTATLPCIMPVQLEETRLLELAGL